MFATGPWGLGSIPGWVIPKTFKMVLDASLLNTQHYKVRIKGKVEKSWERVAPFPTPWCSSYRKGSLGVSLDYGRQLYFYWVNLLFCLYLLILFFYLLKLKLILFYNRVVYYFTRLFLILFSSPVHYMLVFRYWCIYPFILVESYQRLKKWYLILPCLTLSIIRYVSRVKWSNPGKEVAPSPTPRCSSYWKGSLRVALDYSRQLYFLLILYIVFTCLNSWE